MQSTNSPPLAAYVVRMDDAFYREVERRLRPVRRFGQLRSAASLTLLAFVLVFILVRAIADRNWSLVLVPIVLFSLAALVLLKVRTQGLDLYRKSADYGSDVRLNVTDEGVETSGTATSSNYRWPAFARAVLDAEGILLVLQQGGCLWLPDSARISGARDSTDQQILEHVAEVERR